MKHCQKCIEQYPDNKLWLYTVDRCGPRHDALFCLGECEVMLMFRNAKCCQYAYAAGATTEQRRGIDMANSVFQ